MNDKSSLVPREPSSLVIQPGNRSGSPPQKVKKSPLAPRSQDALHHDTRPVPRAQGKTQAAADRDDHVLPMTQLWKAVVLLVFPMLACGMFDVDIWTKMTSIVTCGKGGTGTRPPTRNKSGKGPKKATLVSRMANTSRPTKPLGETTNKKDNAKTLIQLATISSLHGASHQEVHLVSTRPGAVIVGDFIAFVWALVRTLSSSSLIPLASVNELRATVTAIGLSLIPVFCTSPSSPPKTAPSAVKLPSSLPLPGGRGNFDHGQLVFCSRPLYQSSSQPGRPGPVIILGFFWSTASPDLQVVLAPMASFKGKHIARKRYIKSLQRRHHLNLPCLSHKPGDPGVVTFRDDWISTRKYSYLNCYWLHVASIRDIKLWDRGGRGKKRPHRLTADSRKEVLLANLSARQQNIVQVSDLRKKKPTPAVRNRSTKACTVVTDDDDDLDPAVLWFLCWDQQRQQHTYTCYPTYDMAAKNLLSAFPAAAAVHAYPTTRGILRK